MESSRSRSPHATEARAEPEVTTAVEEVRSAAVASSVAQEEAARVISDAPSDAPPAVEPAGQPAAAGSGSEPAARPVRLIGLDVARGLMLVVSVAVDAWITMPAWFAHAPWAGVHPIDLVFPTFVTLSGCGLAFAYGRRVPLGPTARRVVVLLLAGLAYNAFTQFAATGRVEWATFHLPGVLQFYAALVLAVALLHLVVRRWWMWPIWTVALALAYTWWLTSYAAGCPTGALTPECNPSRVLDPALFGVEHIYHQGRFGHDPEGVVALLGALVAVCGGASIGHVLRTSGLRGWRRIAVGLTVLATFVATALWTAQFVDPMKRLWTPPFSLGVAAACGLVLLVLHLLLDSARDSAPDSALDSAPAGSGVARRVRDVATYPLVALGRNSLLVYFGSHVLMLALLTWPRGAPGSSNAGSSYAHRLAATAPSSVEPALWLVLVAVTAWTGLACLLHWRRLYLRP